MKRNILILIIFVSIQTLMAQFPYQYSWKFYTPGNTGILGDYVDAIWIDHDGDPYIAAYTPGWEEGGFSKFIQNENRWINYSNVDYPIIGSIYDVGSSRISDVVEDASGNLWLSTWRGLLKFDPNMGASSLQFWGVLNSLHPGGTTRDIDIAPDSSIWGAIISVTWGWGGLVQYQPNTQIWRFWGFQETNNNWPSNVSACENVSIQEKPTGGYIVWIDGEGGHPMITFDSDTQLFTTLPQDNIPGEVMDLPGKKCIDDEGNLWALRFTSFTTPPSLDYRTPNGVWVTPAQPSSAIASDIWAFHAFGNHNALIVGSNSEVFLFNGTSWQSKGMWKEGSYTSALAIDDFGNIWASGVGGAAKRDHSSGLWQRYRISNTSQIDYWVEDLSIDNQGNVWMTGNGGTGIGGFQKFDGIRWTGFNQFNYGLGHPFPFSTDNSEVIYFRPSNGNIVVNPMYSYLHEWNGTNYTSLYYPSSRSEGVAEDSQNRLWSLGEYYNLKYLDPVNQSWTTEDFMGIGNNIKKDPTRPGTIWASSMYQVLRTDGSYRFSKTVDDLPELNPQSDYLTGVIPINNGFAWVGSNQGLFLIDANTNTYQYYSPLSSTLPGDLITPLAYTSDGRIWFTNFQSTTTQPIGLYWFDGTQFGVFPVQDGGLPHAQIADIEVKENTNGYSLWISCLSRGIAVLNVVTNDIGVSENQLVTKNNSIIIYPNPVENILNLHTIFDTPIGYEIYNSLGQVIDNMRTTEKTIDISELKSGIYFIRFSDEIGNILESHKFVKK